MKKTPFRNTPVAMSVAMGLSVMSTFALAQETPDKTTDVERIEVTGSLGSLPGQDVEAVFGFGKSILETPRSASTVSQEQMERFNITDIDELVAFAPGTFTQSFFGVAGSLDVRGTPGEAYFRGVKRLDNPGNYPTPIGASSRVDIVRGPASPIYGPAKVGGYLNFIPKSARSSRGQYLEQPTGAMSYTMGTWDKNIITAEVGGPTKLAGKDAGFYIYGEVENSGSYYQNTKTDQTILQASFNVDVTENLRFEFGGMYHDYDGNQVAGWNRLTQELIDNGTYVTGTAKALDTDGDGSISHQEYDAATVYETIDGEQVQTDGVVLFDIFYPSSYTNDNLFDAMGLENSGKDKLKGDQVLVAADDQLVNTVQTLYFDAIYFTDSGWEIKNQLFYEAYENLNENAYGFSQFHDTWVVEDKLVFSKEFDTDSMTMAVQVSPSIRYTDFEHGDDYTHEFFDRRDLTMASSALDRRLLATRIDDDYTEYYYGDYLDLGIAALADFTWNFGLNAVIGVRYDSMDMESNTPLDKILGSTETGVYSVSGDDSGVSWTASLSYKTPIGLIPYVTASEQSTIIAGQGAEITTDNVANSSAFAGSELFEYGIKGTFLEDTLYFALSIYEQERTDYSAQATVTNNTTKNEGAEFELRWVVTDSLVVTAGYTKMDVYNLTTQDEGVQFGFVGSDDMPGVDGAAMYGGVVQSINIGAVGEGGINPKAKKAGVPENIYSLTATYDFQNGFAANASIVDVDATYSGFSNAVKLPAYTLVNAGVNYQAADWSVSLTVKNLTDERYFRSNFPDLFGSTIVLPELPRHFNAKFAYKF